jgi:hypothetical protein
MHEGDFYEEEKQMLRKMLIALMAVATLGAGSTAMARGGHGGSFGGGGRGGGFSGGAFHGSGFGSGAMRGGGMVRAPMANGRVHGAVSGRTFNRNNFAFNRGFRHFRFRNRNFVAFGFAGPYFADYGYYDDCWRPVRTYYGWRSAYVCGDQSYWGY